MSYTCFDVEINNDIAHIMLSRPEKRNSMILEFWDELPEIVRDIDHNVKARVIVISSTGPHFCAGLDLNAFLQVAQQDSRDERTKRLSQGASFYARVAAMQQAISVLAECRLPVLAAIQGGCIGGGVDLVTACDCRYATDDAYFRIEETNIAMTADVGTYPRLAHLVADGLVRELSYTGRSLLADEAKSSGLVNQVFSDHQSMLDAVMGIAAQIASKAPMAVYGCKRMINYARDHSISDTLDYVRIWNASMLQPEEMMEAITAKGQKRDGDFVALPVIKKTVA